MCAQNTIYYIIGSELPKVLIKVLFGALFWGKELFCALFLVLLKVPELLWALFKALYYTLFGNTFLSTKSDLFRPTCFRYFK